MGSLRFRLSLWYSLLLFGLAAVLIGGIYVFLARSVSGEPMTRQIVTAQPVGPGVVVLSQREVTVFNEFEQQVNERTLDQLQSVSLIALVALFPASVLVGWLVAGRMLRPVQEITDVANQIQSKDLSQRIHLEGPDDELKMLADTFDGMLDRLEEGAEAQRRFLEETAHELRNPLAVATTNLDVAIASSDDDDERLEAARRGLLRLRTLVEAQLQYARHGQITNEQVSINLAELVHHVVAQHHQRAVIRDVDVFEETSDVTLVGQYDAIERSLVNLIDNALRLAPSESTVTVGCGRDAGWIWLAVADEGPGIPEELAATVFGRNVRGDEDHPGSGLGLAIVRQVAEAHRGAACLIAYEDRSTFVMWFPESDTQLSGSAPEIDPFTLA
ncbi:MAG: ATP-binding protein [Acidimicrobiales bacterium]